MKLGAEPKKMAILVGLLLVAAYLFYSNSSSDVRRGAAPSAPPKQPAPLAVPSEVREQAPRARQEAARARQEFRPSLKPRRPEDRLDPVTADPALHLEQLARLQQVKFTGGMRSLFEFTQAPPPPPQQVPVAKILPKQAARKFMGPMPPPPPAAPAPVFKPQAPPIPLKFFGYVNASRGGARRAFFLEGENIHVAAEGELIKKRYKLVRIGVNSVTMEDTQFEGQQTLQLMKEQGG